MSPSNRVHGYLIVSLPGRSYRGIEREPWACVRDAYSKGNLPAELTNWYERLGDYDSTQLWGELSASLAPCLRFLDFVGTEVKLEVLAVHSPYLERIGHPSVEDESAYFLGYDVRPVGDSSLLYEMENKIIRMPTVLSERLNESGLLREESDMALVADLYKKLADLDVVEPIEPWESIAADQPCPLETVAVYAINVGKNKSQPEHLPVK